MTEAKSIGVREVAAAAGVSRQTVSRVVNNHPSIRPETRERVLAVIDDLGFRPNRAARMLGTNRSGMIGVISAIGAAEYGPASALHGISAAAAARDYTVSTVYVSGADRAALADAVTMQLGFMVEGLIFIAPQNRTLEVIRDLGVDIPYVMMQAGVKADLHSLYIDQVGGARLATRHLLELGHRVIAHVAGPQEWLEADARMRGYLDELSTWDVEPLPPILGDWTAESGYRVGQQLARRRDVTAVFASNDSTALGVLHALHESRVTVPTQVSVVGFDDVPVAAHAWPPLTTVRQDFAELGSLCVERLVGGGLVEPVALVPRLIVRDSTGPAPSLSN